MSSIRSPRDSTSRARLVRLALVVLVLTVTAFAVLVAGFVDLHVYRAAGYAWLHGRDLYGPGFLASVPGTPLPFIYPPISAVLFSGLHLLPWHLAKGVLTLLSVLGLLATTVTVARRVYGPRSATAVVAGYGVAAVWFLFEPVRQTLGFGQVNLILMGLVVLDCLLPRTRWPRGLLVGTAAAIKLTPLVFVLFFLLRRRYRDAAVAVGSFAGVGLVGFVLAPGQSATYWFGFLQRTDSTVGVAYAFNQSYRAVLSRLVEGPAQTVLWLVLVLATLALACVAARRAAAAGDDVLALLAIACWVLLVSPLSWSHHWVWAVPAAIALLPLARRRSVPVRCALGLAAVVFAIGPHILVPSSANNDVERHWSWGEHLIGSSYVLAGMIFLLVLASRRPRHRPVS
jgi:alpha-1,2-mannosyltransferase